MISGIYRIWSKCPVLSGLNYIGQSKDVERRWKQHSVKYPSDAWNYEVLLVCPPESLDFLEKAFILGYDSYNNGLNKSPGCPGNYERTATTRKKVAEANRRRAGTFSEETRKKMSSSAKTRGGWSKCNEANHRIVKCPHCGKEGQQFGMVRWHFDNCKVKP